MENPKKAETFQLGESVQWESTSNGVTKVKKGIITQVVPEGNRPYMNFRFRPNTRNHTSYLVETEKGKKYWPLVKKLISCQGAPKKRNTWLGPKEERLAPETTIIKSKCPGKWAFIDTETGEIWLNKDNTFQLATPKEIKQIKTGLAKK